MPSSHISTVPDKDGAWLWFPSHQNGHCLLTRFSSMANFGNEWWHERERESELSGRSPCTSFVACVPFLVVIPLSIQKLTFSSTPPHLSVWWAHSSHQDGCTHLRPQGDTNLPFSPPFSTLDGLVWWQLHFSSWKCQIHISVYQGKLLQVYEHV